MPLSNSSPGPYRISYLDDIELLLVKSRLALDHNLLSQLSLPILYPSPLFFIEKASDLRVHLHQNVMTPQFRRGPFDLPEDVITDGDRRFNQATALAVRAG